MSTGRAGAVARRLAVGLLVAAGATGIVLVERHDAG
ncbi:MAG: hypothetical protein RJB57_1391, partial [Actinomycetota bacterium]